MDGSKMKSAGCSRRAKKVVGEVSINPSEISEIKNKSKRIKLFKKFKRIKRREKREAQTEKKILIAKHGPDAVPKEIPRTIERSREYDETVVETLDDEDLQAEEAADTYAAHYRKESCPKILLTCTKKPTSVLKFFIRDLNLVIPNSTIRYRKEIPLQKFATTAMKFGFTDMIVLNEDNKKPNSMMVVHLPDGPTAFFRLSSVRTIEGLKCRRYNVSHLRPEVLLNHFTTRLGRSVARILGAIFHHTPNFTGRRVCTMHNQRDFIFFRHHVYEFHNEEKVATRLMGPNFTLKLKWLRRGMMDGDYEWVEKRKEQETSRSKFML